MIRVVIPEWLTTRIVSNEGVGKMRNCGTREVKCGIGNCGNECGMEGKMWNAENVNRPATNSRVGLSLASEPPGRKL